LLVIRWNAKGLTASYFISRTRVIVFVADYQLERERIRAPAGLIFKPILFVF
jgi:hypothetical protein